ncbi:hypothetical protein HGRIS_006639 [Hohenbuehelia grisea]|uniref:DUF6534 domain-containing protein n=1 Tax=Hohenbuehelia grisea TaxID=104357 RepID=A0ABR3JB42_9AGAR
MAFNDGQTLDNTLGSLFIGSIAAALLYGVTSLQAYWYYHWYHGRDSRVHQISVGLLWGLDTVHLILIVHGVYHYCVEGFGNRATLLEIVWSMKLQVTVNVVIILLVQALYAYRVWLLGGYHNSIVAYFVVATVLGGFAIGIILAYKVYTVTLFSDHEHIGWAIIASLATSTVVDFIIAFSMCYYLRKSRGLQSRLNSKLSTMMQFVLSSGFLTSACSTTALVAYVAMPHTLVFIGVESLLTKLYINSFLAMLNARDRPHDDKPRPLSVHVQQSNSLGTNHPSSSASEMSLSTPPSSSSWKYNTSPHLSAKDVERDAATRTSSSYPW